MASQRKRHHNAVRVVEGGVCGVEWMARDKPWEKTRTPTPIGRSSQAMLQITHTHRGLAAALAHFSLPPATQKVWGGGREEVNGQALATPLATTQRPRIQGRSSPPNHWAPPP